MKLTTLYGVTTKHYPTAKYKIDWDGPSLSKLQKQVKDFLRNVGGSWTEEFLIPGSKLRVDFLNTELGVAVEMQSSIHYKFNKFMHKAETTGYLAQIKRDLAKKVWFERNNITLIEIEEQDLPITVEIWQKRCGEAGLK